MAISHSTPPIRTELIHSPFAQVLHANGPDPARATKLELYAWLVGRWEFDITTFLADGNTYQGSGEIHAGWVLQGRAIQDVWMIPCLRDRGPGIAPMPGAGNWYGTTLRIYDPALDAWRIRWSDPATNFFGDQIGRAQGSDIVQTGPDPRGGSMRWTFSEILPDSFHWTAEHASDDETWRREVEIRARRMDVRPARNIRALGFGSAALGAVAFGAFAIGATAIGALAIGRLAVGALSIGRGRVRALRIDNLDVRRLHVGKQLTGAPPL